MSRNIYNPLSYFEKPSGSDITSASNGPQPKDIKPGSNISDSNRGLRMGGPNITYTSGQRRMPGGKPKIINSNRAPYPGGRPKIVNSNGAPMPGGQPRITSASAHSTRFSGNPKFKYTGEPVRKGLSVRSGGYDGNHPGLGRREGGQVKRGSTSSIKSNVSSSRVYSSGEKKNPSFRHIGIEIKPGFGKNVMP